MWGAEKSGETSPWLATARNNKKLWTQQIRDQVLNEQPGPATDNERITQTLKLNHGYKLET